MGTDKDDLWKEILQSKYKSWRTLKNLTENKHESWWQRDLRKVGGKGQNENQFDNNISWSRGRGNKILFWKDNQLGNSSLLERFPRMYANSITQEAKVKDI